MSSHGCPQDLFSFCQSLCVIYVGVRTDECLALREGEVELANQFDDFIDGFLVPNVNQKPLIFVVDQIDIAAQNMTGLKIYFDDVREDRLPLKHELVLRQVTGRSVENQHRRVRTMSRF